MNLDKIYLGNIITMDEDNLRATAIGIKDGLISFVGKKEDILKEVTKDTEIIDLGNSTIYPGFLEAHCHPFAAGKFLDKESMVDLSSGNSNEEYIDLLEKFIKDNPNKKIYLGSSFIERDEKPTASMIDKICKDKPVILNSADGHSLWLNTKAMELCDLNEEAVKKYGTELVRVDSNNKPTGYISEGPVFEIEKKITVDIEDGKRCLLAAQEFFFSKGYTGVYDAGIELLDRNCIDFYKALIKENKLKLRVFAGSLIDENCKDIKSAVKHINDLQKDNSEYFTILGVKTFSDGVVEAHTAYLIDDYNDEKGYKGAQRMTNINQLTELYIEANKYHMNVHVHTVGDGAVKVNLNAMEKAFKVTGRTNNKNVLAHLQLVDPNDIKRFNDLNVIAVVAPLWSPKDPTYFKQEIEYVGIKRAENSYPIKSFLNNNVMYAFHTDFPVSKTVDIPKSIYTAVNRYSNNFGEESMRNKNEAISRYEALKGLTINVAYMWNKDDKLGSLKVGKVANMSVYTNDFLLDDIEDVIKSKLVCTIVDGEIVYSNK